MRFNQWLKEDITIPINVGDIVLGGKFKNKRITVKEIGKNEKGDITINGKSLLRFRIIPQEEVEESSMGVRTTVKTGRSKDFIFRKKTKGIEKQRASSGFANTLSSYFDRLDRSKSVNKRKPTLSIINKRVIG